MSKKVKISSIFPTYLFWDVNYEKLDSHRDSSFIIPRALYMTDKKSFNEDIQRLESIYDSKLILNCLISTKENISNEVCELVAIRYSVPLFQRFKVQ